MNQPNPQPKETAFYIYFAAVLIGIILFSFTLGRFSNFWLRGTTKFNIERIDGNLLKITVEPFKTSHTITKDSLAIYINDYCLN